MHGRCVCKLYFCFLRDRQIAKNLKNVLDAGRFDGTDPYHSLQSLHSLRGAEAIRKLYVENFPAIVVIDQDGNNLYETSIKKFASEIE